MFEWKRFLAAWVVGLTALSAFSQTMPPRTTWEIRWFHRSSADVSASWGDALGENAVNVVIMGEGFSSQYRDRFFSEAERTLSAFTAVPFPNFFNLFLLWLPSQEDGARSEEHT